MTIPNQTWRIHASVGCAWQVEGKMDFDPMQSSRKTFLATSPVGLVTDQAH